MPAYTEWRLDTLAANARAETILCRSSCEGSPGDSDDTPYAPGSVVSHHSMASLPGSAASALACVHTEVAALGLFVLHPRRVFTSVGYVTQLKPTAARL